MAVDVIIRSRRCGFSRLFLHLTALHRKFTVSFARVVLWKQWKKVRNELNGTHYYLGRRSHVPLPDIRFPTLPKWFTTPLRAHAKRSEMIHLPDGSSQPSSPIPSSSKHLEHDHALLESLYYSVFETRFVNTRPTGAWSSFPRYQTLPLRLPMTSDVGRGV